MKKIMFNDKYGLTDAVLNGKKTMTRRNIPVSVFNKIDFKTFCDGDEKCALINPADDIWGNWRLIAPYKVGEVVAISQSYKDIADDFFFAEQCAANEESVIGKKYERGWGNKMYVSSYYMPHRIKITDVKLQLLNNITEEETYKEGIYYYNCGIDSGFTYNGTNEKFGTGIKAFESLIDKISGKGTWEKNPWVFAYSFELVK
jgi:hypothetical protein